MNKTKQVLKYLGLDFLGSAISWAIFYFYRKTRIELEQITVESVLEDSNFINGILGIATLWIFMYTLLGNYRKIYRKSRLVEFGKTILQHVVGVLIIFFVFLLDDQITAYAQFYSSIIVYYFIHTFFCIWV